MMRLTTEEGDVCMFGVCILDAAGSCGSTHIFVHVTT